jgi:hypothetical protein
MKDYLPVHMPVQNRADGGTRTLFSYLLRGLKQSRTAERHYANSRQLTVTVPKVCPRCAHVAPLARLPAVIEYSADSQRRIANSRPKSGQCPRHHEHTGLAGLVPQTHW